MSAISRNFKKQIRGIITEIIEKSIVQRYYIPKKPLDKSEVEKDDDITIILD